MKLKWLISTTAIALLIVVALLGLAGHDSVVAAQDASSKIEGVLLDQFTADGSADYIVRFTEQADLSAASAMDWNARGEFVVNTLHDTATRSQMNAKSILDAAGLKYQTFFAGNDLYVWSGTLTDANALAALPEVYFIRATRTYSIDPVTQVKQFNNIRWAGDLLASNALTTVGDAPDALAWGISYTGADQFWTAFGVQGDGMLVANIDTGVQYDHPALDQAYKCSGNPGDPICWDDPSNICGGTPCDNQGHGTHTMGTMVGDDDPGLTWQAGMAPNAQWIACKGCESNSCSDFALTSCADWILAPGGEPANRPDVVNNSWGGGGGDNWYQTYVQAWVAAGIFPAFSAGNNGSGCSTLGSPGDYQESFGSAAHDSSGTIASFSSRGPSAFGHDPYTKPNIAAPGVSVCSSVPTNGWSCGYSGTSMASPHSAGAVALLWSCNPGLVGQIDATFQLLQNNTEPAPDGNCGAPPDGEGNYTYGYGYLNVLDAGIAGCGTVDTGYLDGYVYDINGDPIEGAAVTAAPGTEGNQVNALTDPTGYYTMTLVVGTYDVTASKVNYASQTVTGIEIFADTVTHQDFTLNFLGSWTPGPTMCFDWTRLDGEYYPGTGKIYFLGGRSGTDTSGIIYSFDPITEDCASTGAVMPNPISNYTVNLVNDGANDLLCTFGGRQADGTVTLNVQCYNPNTNTASVVTDLPAAWTGYTPGANVVVDNMVYIFGGFNPSVGMTARTDKYDPVANSFTQLGDLHLARAYIMATSVDGIIYGFGGDTWDGAALNAQTISEKMDPGVGTWDDAGVADLPVAGDEGQAFGFDSSAPYDLANQIVIATLSQWSGSSASVVLYDVASNSYNEDFPDLINARRNHAGVLVPIDSADPGDGLPGMWVFGGYFGSDNPPYAPAEFYPLVLTTPRPKIVVTPASLEASLLPDDTTTQELTIENAGTLPLDWTMIEIPGMKVSGVSSPFVPVQTTGGTPNAQLTVQSPSRPVGIVQPAVNPQDVLWDQPLSSINQNAYVDQDFSDFAAYSSFLADDFVNAEPWVISNIFVPGDGWNGFASLLNADSLTWQIYTDDAGVPNGDPSGGGNPPLWTLTLAPTDAQVVITNGTPGGYPSNTMLNLASPVILPPGHYWLVFYPTLNFGSYGQFGRQASDTTNGYTGQFINPGGGFGYGTDWQAWTVLGPTQTDIAFRLEGSLLEDVPWLSEVPTSGTVPAGGSVVVEVTFDSTGLTAGDYLAGLDVYSNDPDTQVVSVPVTMTVLAQADLGLTKTDAPDPVRVGDVLTYTLLVTNDGPQDATGVEVVDTLPAEVTFMSASAGCSEAAGVVTCDVGDLAMEDVAEITIVVTADVEGTITNTAMVSGIEVDPDLTNNEATEDTTVIPAMLYIYLPLVMK